MKQIFLILLIFCGLNAFSQKIVKDTLIITNDAINFIKIGNEVYELQKSITLKKVEGYQMPIFQPFDTARLYSPLINGWGITTPGYNIDPGFYINQYPGKGLALTPGSLTDTLFLKGKGY